MINIDKFFTVDDWPTHGFMRGVDILDSQTFDTIRQINYDLLTNNPAYGDKRKTLSFSTVSSEQYNDAASQALQDLVKAIDNFEMLEAFITKSYANSPFSINNVWHGGIDTLRRLYNGSYLMINEDRPFHLTPHSDTRVVIANIQIYVDPDDAECGTTFHDAKDWEVSQTLPFTPNTGYFQVNCDLGVHSVTHTKDFPRRSILMGWKI